MYPKTLPLMGLAVVLGAGVAVGQEPAGQAGPPKVIAVSREEIKPGKMSPHEKAAASFVALLVRANLDVYRLGLIPVSGDENVVMYLQGFDSFAEVEASTKKMQTAVAGNPAWKAEMDRIEAQGADYHARQQTAYFVHRPELSYRPNRMKEVAQARFMNVTTIRIKPGRVPDWIDYVKTLNVAREKADIDVHGAVYQVQSGAPANTFLVFTASRSLKDIDEALAKADERQKAIEAALGGREAVAKRQTLISEIVAESYTDVYAMTPSISRPSPQFVAADPDFWSPRPAAPAKAVATRKESPKR